MATLTRDDIFTLARLARLSITDDEATEFESEINEILKYVTLLQEADVTDLEPTSQVTGLTNVTRADEIHDYGYPLADLIKNIPAQQDGQIKVRRMIG